VNTVIDSYDVNGRKQESTSFSIDRDVHTDKTTPEHRTHAYHYDDRTGRLVQIISRRRNSDKVTKTAFSYDLENRLVEEAFFSETNEIVSKRTYEYNKNGTEIIITNFLFFESRPSRFEKTRTPAKQQAASKKDFT
jgi:hypothetical protein